MALLLPELKEKLVQQFDVDTLVELLELSPEDLLEAFSDKVEEKYTSLCEAVEDEQTD